MSTTPPLTIIEPATQHTHTVIFLHGRSDTAHRLSQNLAYSLTSQNQTLPEVFPSFRWVFPTARITPSALNPIDRLSQWFDVWNARDLTDREDLQAEGLRESVGRVLAVMKEEVRDGLEGQWEKLVVMGISQGGATGVHTLLNMGLGSYGAGRRRRIGGFVGFSCRMVFPGRSLRETRGFLGNENDRMDDEGEETAAVLEETPIMLQHCEDDTVVRIEDGKILRDTLVRFGGKRVEWKQYPDGGHWFNAPGGIDDVVGFLGRKLSVRPVIL